MAVLICIKKQPQIALYGKQLPFKKCSSLFVALLIVGNMDRIKRSNFTTDEIYQEGNRAIVVE